MTDPRLRLRLPDFFARQDLVVPLNADSAQDILPLLERALSIAFDITLHINETHELRDAEPYRRITANLLHVATAGLVSATRMTLFGDHVSALTILRLAFEDTCHAEFFRHRPELASEWDKSGTETDLEARRKLVDSFRSQYAVMRNLESRDADPTRSRSRLFRDLSSFGTHSNPATTFMRLALPPERGANLGFVSKGKRDATLLTTSYILHVGAYVVSEMHDSFSDILTDDLAEDCLALSAEYSQVRALLPAALSLI